MSYAKPTAKQKDAIKEAVADIREHFRDYSWPLDFSYYTSFISNKLLGFDVSTELFRELHNEGLQLVAKGAEDEDGQYVLQLCIMPEAKKKKKGAKRVRK